MVEVSIATLSILFYAHAYNIDGHVREAPFLTSIIRVILISYTDAFNRYSAISILVNIPATLFATAVYEFILKDSFASIAKGHNIHEDGEEGLARYLTKVGTLDQGMSNAAGRSTDDSYQKGKHSSPV